MGAPRSKSIVITGCSKGGIGESLAREFAKKRYRVFATVRDTTKAAELAKQDGVEVVELDVTSRGSIDLAVREIRSQLEGDKLDILINNAGMGATGPLLEASLDQAQCLFNTNVWGVLAVTQAFKEPILSAKGKIVNVSSVGSILNTPWLGLYSASKAAVTMLSDTLRLELAPFGVTVITAMLGHIESNFHKNDAWTGLPPNSMYKSAEDDIANAAAGGIGPKMTQLEVFTKQFVKDIQNSSSGHVYRGAAAQTVRVIAYHLPASVIDSMLNSSSGLNKIEKKPVEDQ